MKYCSVFLIAAVIVALSANCWAAAIENEVVPTADNNVAATAERKNDKRSLLGLGYGGYGGYGFGGYDHGLYGGHYGGHYGGQFGYPGYSYASYHHSPYYGHGGYYPYNAGYHGGYHGGHGIHGHGFY